jgi:hypothetical protein
MKLALLNKYQQSPEHAMCILSTLNPVDASEKSGLEGPLFHYLTLNRKPLIPITDHPGQLTHNVVRQRLPVSGLTHQVS